MKSIFKTRILLVTFLLSGAIHTQAQVKQEYSLQQCLLYALDKGHKVRISDLDIEKAEASYKESKGALLPQINAGGAFNNNIASPVTMLPGELVGQPGTMVSAELMMKYEANATIQLEQVVFDPVLFVGLKVSKNAQELAKLKKQMSKEEIIYEVSQIYYDILHNQKQLENIEKTVSLLDSISHQTALRVAQDLTREIDLNRIKVNISALNVNRDNLQSVVEQQKNYLKVLIGMPLEVDISFIDITNTIELSLHHPVSNSILENKIEVQLLNKEREATNLQIKQLKMAYSPTISVYGSAGYAYQSNRFKLNAPNTWSDVTQIGIKLSIPIYDGSTKHHKIRQSNISLQQLNEDVEYTKRTISNEIVNAKMQLATSYKAINAQNENLQLADKTYKQATMLYQEGLYSVTDLLETEDAFQKAQTAHVSELINYKKAEINLMKAEGTLMNLVNNEN